MSFLARFMVLTGHKEVAVTGAAALAVALTGSVYAATSPASSHSAASPRPASVTGTQAAPSPSKSAPPPPKPLYMTAIKPGQDSNGTIDGTQPITVTFNAPLSPSSVNQLSVYPKIPGSWKVSGDQATFTPQTGFNPGTTVSVTTPEGAQGVSSTPQTKVLAMKTQKKSFTTGGYSQLRLQELLAQLGYLPVKFNPSSGQVPGSDAKSQLSAAYSAPQGSFGWAGSYPSQLTSMWKTDAPNMILTGAVQAFEARYGLAMDGQAGPEVWQYLLLAAEKGQTNPDGYTYALVSQGPGGGNNLAVYHDGRQLLATPANTGSPGAPSVDGTFPVYERTPFQVMKGKNPDGTKYKDPVHWIAYFNGGDAIHGFVRASYGTYQSVGCVEVPVATAQKLYPYLTYGTLVTVQGTPAPSKA